MPKSSNLVQILKEFWVCKSQVHLYLGVPVYCSVPNHNISSGDFLLCHFQIFPKFFFSFDVGLPLCFLQATSLFYCFFCNLFDIFQIEFKKKNPCFEFILFFFVLSQPIFIQLCSRGLCLRVIFNFYYTLLKFVQFYLFCFKLCSILLLEIIRDFRFNFTKGVWFRFSVRPEIFFCSLH